MFGNKKPTDPSEKPTVNERKKVEGVTYDLCRTVEGKRKTIGTLFLRSSGTGGVAWVTGDDGQKHEVAVFPRKKKEGAKTE